MKLTLSRRAIRLVALDGDALLKAGASSVLAIDEAATTGGVALLAEEAADEKPADKLGIVRVQGPLAQRAVVDLCAYVDGYDAVTARFGAALADKKTSAVLLVIDSPGGDVAGLEEAVARMRLMRDEFGKPVVAYVDELAASAAYWIAASVADEIHIPGSGRVGSIGCIGAFVDQSEAYKKAGITWHVVRDPAGKADMMPAAPVAELAEKRLGETVRGASARFVAAMAEARGVDAEAIRKLNAAVLTGNAAVTAGLANKISSLEGATVRALELAKQRREKRQKDSHMSLIAKMAVLVGLSAEASAEQAEVAFDNTSKDILEATGSKTLVAAAAEVDKLKASLEAYKEKAEKYDALAAKVKQEADQRAADEVKGVLDAAVKDGRISPAKRAAYEEKTAKYGVDWLKSLVAELPIQGGTEDGANKTGADTSGERVDAELGQLLGKLGMTEDDYRKAHAAGAV